ncbi:MAG: molybdopterin-guanine dinucleotide biosynthesis protein B [Dehalococcoidales bacterium]|nr:molybdopterin-guanine dinucleotide biosynthesis protein B [Dehalococcoidales bacterium]
MQPIISIVGRSESGKTTLLEGLIAELKGRGYRVAVIKHSAENVEVDTVNKDTWRFSQAGSEISVISSGRNLGIFKRLEHDASPQELVPLIPECDLILTEGFKHSNYPKIEVHRKAQGSDLVSLPQQLLGVVTDEPLPVKVPQFSREDVKEIADLIEKSISSWQREDDVALAVNGIETAVKPAFRDLLARTLSAMLSGEKDIREVKQLRIFFRRKTA